VVGGRDPEYPSREFPPLNAEEMPEVSLDAPSGRAAVRVAVVGGGCGSLAAAYELTRPELEGRFEVTVYQMGWRLGGKGASGRGVADRIEEHGLHLWMGFYENAFRLMRECYAQLPEREGRRLGTWEEAFTPAPYVGVSDLKQDGDWDFWIASFPPGKGLPGDPPDRSNPFTVLGYLRQSAELVAELLRSAAAGQGETNAEAVPRSEKAADGRSLDPEKVGEAADRLLRYGQLATTAALFEASDILRQAIGTWVPGPLRPGTAPFMPLVEAIAAGSRRQLERMAEENDEMRRVWTVVDLIMAILRGATAHRLALDPQGFDAINDYDWREWLRKYGASEQSLDSGFMRGIYDLCFAYEDGDIEKPRLAAGVALRGAMRMFFTYRGALFWRMNAGMGDIVFTPLYEVLKERGVRFEFFHKLTNVGVGEPETKGQPPHVSTLAFDVQAEVKRGREYQPLVDVNGVPSWPAAPDFGQLRRGRKLVDEDWHFEAQWDTRTAKRKTLKVGEHFDYVVLGVPVGVLPKVAPELIARERRWADMVHHVRTVPTQALQLWLKKSVEDLGWTSPQTNLSGYVEPFDTWADMRHLIPEESWPGGVEAIAYFCSVLEDNAPVDVTREVDQEQRSVVRENAIRFVQRDLGRLWPGALSEDGSFDWALLASDNGAEKGTEEGAGIDGQYWVANVGASDRYTLSLPGSMRYRLSPLDLSFDNLTIAGDWTQSGLDSGCIESAVMSGMLAAHALSGFPRLEDIVGYDHP